MIVFKTLRWKNFLSTGNRFIEVRLDKTPTTMLCGKNGSGKSTMIDALCFALFGKPFRAINKPQLINGTNQKECVVEIEFSVHNVDYFVRRGIKPNIFEITRNGKPLDQESKVTDFQTHLEKNILGLNFDTFTQVVILGSSSYVPFMQLKTSDRREVVEDLLDIKIFSAMNFVLKAELASTKESIRTIENDAKLIKEKMKMQKRFLNDSKEQIKQVIAEKQAEIAKSMETIALCEANIDMTNNTIEVARGNLERVVGSNDVCKKLHSEETEIYADIKKIKKELSFFESNDSCHTCQQTIDAEFKKNKIINLTRETEKNQNKLDELTTQIKEAEEQLAKFKKYSEQITYLQTENVKEQAKIDAENRYIARLNEEISKLYSTGDVSVEKHQNELDQLRDDLAELSAKHKEATYKRGLQEVAFEMLKDSGIKTKIIRQYLPAINKLINRYLKELNFPISFHLDENFKEQIESRFGESFSYASFSEGQKMRVDLAILFTWVEIAKLKNSVNTNLLFFDEIFDSSLDDEGTEDFMKIVRGFGKNINVFVISHKVDQLIDKFDSVIQFELSKGFSKSTVSR